LSTADRLTPFSYAILVLVGRGGAGPHDLRRNAADGRVYWDAAPSQFYAEPKRLEKLGLLEARKEPGRTRERTFYTLTDAGRAALEAWVRTPAAMPRIQHESIVRLLAADLVHPAAVAEGLRALDAQIDEWIGGLDNSRENWSDLEHRSDLLRVNDRYARRLLELKREWLREAEDVLRHRAAEA
jgi:PadR family transcriptional regulator, regulatory protein AphA